MYSLRELLEDQEDERWLTVTAMLENDLDGEIELHDGQLRRLTELLEDNGEEDLLAAFRRAEPATETARRVH